MKSICVRLTKGDDLYDSIHEIAVRYHLKAAYVASAVGCVSEAVIRDAGGKELHMIKEPMEIVSLMGTVSEVRQHLHISLAKKDLSVIGGHLKEGTIISLTCELILTVVDKYTFGKVDDPETGYDEIEIRKE